MALTRRGSKKVIMKTWVRGIPGLLFLVFIGLGVTLHAEKRGNAGPSQAGAGFLIIATDRGYLGNREIKEVYAAFAKDYRARLVFISLAEDYEEAMRQKLKTALAELRAQGAGSIVVLPFVLSDADPYLKRAKALLGSLRERLPFTPAMAADYLTAQVLEDRARAISKDPVKERLVVVGFGSTDAREAAAIRQDLERLAQETSGRRAFKETAIALFFHPAAADEVLQASNRQATEIIRAAGSDKSLRAVVIPFYLGPKHTASMQLGRRIESLLPDLNAAYEGLEILPHPNALLWLKKTANRWIKPKREELGVVLMPHGAGEYVNEPILEAIAPLRSRYNLEVAFGMADADTLQEAIDKVEGRGARRILVLRLYQLSLSLKEETEYVLGLRNDPPAMHPHAGHGGPHLPARVRSGALLTTTGGFDADPLIAEVLYQRVMEVSREPERETVLLLAHGDGNDERDRYWLEQMGAQARYIRAKTGHRFRSIRVATLREDWPDKREKAVADIRRLITQAGRDGDRVLVIANRLSGPGPYRRFLQGLVYVLNDRGIAPHPNLTRWIEKIIEGWIDGLGKAPLRNSAPGTAAAR